MKKPTHTHTHEPARAHAGTVHLRSLCSCSVFVGTLPKVVKSPHDSSLAFSLPVIRSHDGTRNIQNICLCFICYSYSRKKFGALMNVRVNVSLSVNVFIIIIHVNTQNSIIFITAIFSPTTLLCFA